MRFILAIYLSIFFVPAVFGLEKVNQRLLDYAKACPKISASNVPSLVAYLKKGAVSESQTVEVFCYWIAENIAYDTEEYLTDGNSETGNILLTRKGVCQDYSELLRQMCKAAGIECHVVSGYSKGYGYQTNTRFTETDHAWNVVKADGKYAFVDVTWASGYVRTVKGKLVFQKELDLPEILADPNYFAIEHLPADPRWQLREKPITVQSFERNDSISDMLKQTAAYYNFTDSITAYLKVDSMQRVVLGAESAYRFHPITENLAFLADTYFNKGWYLSHTFRDAAHYKLSIAAYEKAIVHYTKLNNSYGTKWISSSRKNISYVKTQLDKLNSSGP